MPDQLPANLRQVVLSPLAAHGRADEVERRLIEAIELGLFREGERLPGEAELAATLGVAPATLREALVKLRNANLVETRRGRTGGTFVHVRRTRTEQLTRRLRRWSASELHDACDMHAAVASSIAGLAAARHDAADLSRLTRHTVELAAAQDQAAAIRADSRFHIDLAAASQSTELTRAEMALQAQRAAVTWLAAGETDLQQAIDRAARSHADIVGAVRRRDAGAAAAVVLEHVQEEGRRVVQARLSLFASAPEPEASTLRDVLDACSAFAEEVFTIVDDARVAVIRAWGLAGPGEPADHLDLAPLAALAARALEPSASISGLGVAFADPAASSRWHWWTRTARSPAPLHVDLDPLHPDFYDFTTAEWFAQPMAAKQPYVAGPFVDVGGANHHICTFAMPVITSDGSTRAVVGVDVRIPELEAVAGPALQRAAGDVALLNQNGNVIAANSSSLLPSTRWSGGVQALEAAVAAGEAAKDERLGWFVARAT